jgi:hypothetical protein
VRHRPHLAFPETRERGIKSAITLNQMATNSLLKAAREMEKAQARAAKEHARLQKEQQKELARQAAEAERAAAKAEVEAFEQALAALTGAHRIRPPFFSWTAQHFSLPPHPPAFHAKNHLREAVETMLLTREYERLEERLSVAWAKDEQVYYENFTAYQERHGKWGRLKALAQQLKAGEATALVDAHAELKEQGVVPPDGTEMALQPCDAKRLYIAIRVDGRDVTPSEVKTLTQAGKLSSKAMPKNRARELYEDHICSRCVAVARQLFATLPITEIIVTAYVPTISTVSGNETDTPVVSAHFIKERFMAMNFDEIDPSDALQSFRHAGDVRASRRGEDFTDIRPLAFEAHGVVESPADELQALLETTGTLRNSFKRLMAKGGRGTTSAAETEQG